MNVGNLDGRAPTACPVCRAPSPVYLMHVDRRDYWRCDVCAARFLDPRQLPAPDEEYAHYLLHENNADDPRYRLFLSKAVDPLLRRLSGACRGLDYGCGPGPALAAMLREAGHDVALYDPYFHPDTAALTRTCDFIACTEVAEHFHRPAEEFDRLDRLLRPGGWLVVMTSFAVDDARFATWRYRMDPTHVVFYRDTTLRKVAEQRGWLCEIPAADVALMRKCQP